MGLQPLHGIALLSLAMDSSAPIPLGPYQLSHGPTQGTAPCRGLSHGMPHGTAPPLALQHNTAQGPVAHVQHCTEQLAHGISAAHSSWATGAHKLLSSNRIPTLLSCRSSCSFATSAPAAAQLYLLDGPYGSGPKGPFVSGKVDATGP